MREQFSTKLFFETVNLMKRDEGLIKSLIGLLVASEKMHFSNWSLCRHSSIHWI